MAESEGMGEDMAEGGEESSEAEVTTDIAILAGKEVEPGDRVTLEVVSVDPDMGSVVLRYPKEESKPPGIDAMADTFNQPPEEQA